MSGRQFERNWGFAHQTMIDATAGTFEDLPERIATSLREEFNRQGMYLHEWLAEEYGGLSVHGIFEIYKVWRRFDRERYKDEFQLQPRVPGIYNPGMSPGHLWIHDTGNTPTSTSKKLKVPPATLKRWLDGKTKEMPDSLRIALGAIGYPWINTLAALQKEHYDDVS